MLLAFDLDGCLVDTYEANRLAYLEAGVVIPPEARYLPASEWKPSQEVVAAKKACYARMLKQHGRELPALSLLRACGGVVLTGASRESASAVWAVFRMPNVMIVCGMSPNEKIEWLRNRAPGIYFDDWDHMIARVRRETTWQAVNVSCL